MEETTTNQSQNNSTKLEKIPNSTGVLVLGILSIVCCFCYGIIGLTLGIIALYMASKGKQLYFENSSRYDTSSYNNLKAGRVCAIIGTILSGLYLLFLIVYILFIGAALSGLPWETMNF